MDCKLDLDNIRILLCSGLFNFYSFSTTISFIRVFKWFNCIRGPSTALADGFYCRVRAPQDLTSYAVTSLGRTASCHIQKKEALARNFIDWCPNGELIVTYNFTLKSEFTLRQRNIESRARGLCL